MKFKRALSLITIASLIYGCKYNTSAPKGQDQIFKSGDIADLEDDNITFTNLNSKYRDLVKIAHADVVDLLKEEELSHGSCERVKHTLRVDIVEMPYAELNQLKDSGEFGPTFATWGSISAMFELSESSNGSNKMYISVDGKASFDSLFIHEYVHAYFYANCVMDLNDNLQRADEELYAEILRKNYVENNENSSSVK